MHGHTHTRQEPHRQTRQEPRGIAHRAREYPALDAPRVLVADDDDDLRALLAAALTDEGYHVTEAADGHRLLELVSSQLLYPVGSPALFDLLVVDVLMPGPNGLWSVATLRYLDWATPVLVITALGQQEAKSHAGHLGAAAVMHKPIDLPTFRWTVAALVGPGRVKQRWRDGPTRESRPGR